MLPYWFGNFALVNAGADSTVLLLAAVTYAVASAGLFNIRLIIRATVIYGNIISLMLGVYEAVVRSLADLLPLGCPERFYRSEIMPPASLSRHHSTPRVASSQGNRLRTFEYETMADR